MIELHPNFLEKNGKIEFAVLPYNEYKMLQEILEDYEDLRLLREAKQKEADAPTVSIHDVKKDYGIK